MGKEIWRLYRAADFNGVGQPGRTIHCFPAGTQQDDANVTDNQDGTYLIKIRPANEGDGVIAPKYDIRDGATLKIPNIPLGAAWRWFSRFQVTQTPQNVSFSGINDENGDPLPSDIKNAMVILSHVEGDRHFYITNVNDTGFTITASETWGDDLPIYVNVLVLVGEA
jgi:hypothetical protein